MIRPRPSGALVLFLAVSALASSASQGSAAPDLPLEFEANQGQFDASTRFVARGSGYSVALGNEGESRIHTASGDTVTLRLLGGSASAARGSDLLPGKTHRYPSADPASWILGIPNFRRVEWSSVYPGIDLVYYGAGRQIEYDFIVHPGADPRRIRIEIAGGGTPRLRDGDLVLTTQSGELRLPTPRVYQRRGNRRVEIASRYRLDGRVASFSVGDYDSTLPVIIDPVIKYSTYLGGSGSESSPKVAVGSDGAAYVGGYTDSNNFVPGSTNTAGIFLTKINAAGTAREYTAFLGANNVRGLAVDATGGLYTLIDGAITPFPGNTGTFAPVRGVALLRLTPSGTIDWSTGFGETSADGSGVALALDAASNVYCLIQPSANRYPTSVGAFKPQPAATAAHVFVIKLNSTGTARSYATYLGNDIASEEGKGIAVDSTGSAVVIGTASNQGAPSPTTAGGYRRTFRNGQEGWLVKLNSAGTALEWATLLVGRSNSAGEAVAVDGSDRVYAAGATEIPTRIEDFPLAEGQALPAAGTGIGRSFLTVFASDGSLVSRHLNGATSGSVSPSRTQLAVTPSGTAWVATQVSGGSTVWPLTGAFDTTLGPGGAFEVWVYRIAGGTMDFATYHGGSGSENPFGIAASGASAWVTGNTTSDDLDLTGALDTVRAGTETFLVKIGPQDYTVQLSGLDPLAGPPGGTFSLTAGPLPELGALQGAALHAVPVSGPRVLLMLDATPVSGVERVLRFRVPAGTPPGQYRLELTARTGEGGLVISSTSADIVITNRALTLREPSPTYGFPGVTVFETVATGFLPNEALLLQRLTAKGTGISVDWDMTFDGTIGGDRRLRFTAPRDAPAGEYRLELAVLTSAGASLTSVAPEQRVLIFRPQANSERAVSHSISVRNGAAPGLERGQGRSVSMQFTVGNAIPSSLPSGFGRAVSRQFILTNAPITGPNSPSGWLRGISSQFTLTNKAPANTSGGTNRAVSKQFTAGSRSLPYLGPGTNRAVSAQFTARNRNSGRLLSVNPGLLNRARLNEGTTRQTHHLSQTVAAGELLTFIPALEEWPPFTSFEYRLEGRSVPCGADGALRFLAPHGVEHFSLELLGRSPLGAIAGQVISSFTVAPSESMPRRSIRVVDSLGKPVANTRVTVQAEGWTAEYFDYNLPLVSMPDRVTGSPARSTMVLAPQLVNPDGVFGRDPLRTGMWPDYVARFRSNLLVENETILDLGTSSNNGAEVRLDGKVLAQKIRLGPGVYQIEIEHWVGTANPNLVLTNSGSTLLPAIAAVTLPPMSTDANGMCEVEVPDGAFLRFATHAGDSGWTREGVVTISAGSHQKESVQ